MKNLIISILFCFVWNISFCQFKINQIPENTKVDTAYSGVGGEIKGMNISGGLFILAGIALGTAAEVITDGGRKGIGFPIIAGGLPAAPGSLVGLGVGSLLAKNHSKLSRSFQIGVGITFSPVFIRAPPFPNDRQPTARYVSGLNIRLLSNEIGKWRYNLGLNHFFTKTYEFEDQVRRKSWQSLNLDLHYLIYINQTLKLYPLVGSQLHNFIKRELYTNFGVGFNFEFIPKLSFYGEVKYSLDPDQDLNQLNYSFGALYYL